MTCKEYLEEIMQKFAIHGDRMRYDRELEAMRYNCEDYESYLDSLKEKYN